MRKSITICIWTVFTKPLPVLTLTEKRFVYLSTGYG